MRLTLVANLEANVRVALVCGEEQVEVVGGADQELGDLGTLVAPYQRRGVRLPVTHLQNIVIHLCFKPAGETD